MPSQFEVRTSQRKMLSVIYLLNELGKAPSAPGIEDILHGTPNEDNSFFLASPLYGALSSFSSRRIKMQIASLEKKGYLVSFIKEEETYYKVTSLGEEIAKEYLAKPLKKRKAAPRHQKRSIIDL